MPVITIRALPQPSIGRAEITRVLSAVSVAAAHAFGVPGRQVWSTWQDIGPGHYVEGAEPASEQPPDTHPPLVDVVAFHGRGEEMIAAALEAIAAAIARELGLDPANVFITYTEGKPGRVFSGGAVLR